MLSGPNIPATRFHQDPNLEIRFPPLPRTVSEVSALVDTAEVPDMPRLAEVIHRDLITAALVLRRINSAYYGLRRRFSNIRQAVALLGFLEVCNLVLTAAMLKLRDVLPSPEQRAIFDHIIRVSTGSAFYTHHIATELGLCVRDSAFTVGLLHAVGRLVLLYNRAEDYEALWYTRDTDLVPSAGEEWLIFGMDHAEVGALAAGQWHLPILIEETIRYYLDPQRAPESDVRLLALALQASASISEQLCLQADEPAKATFDTPSALDVLIAETGHAPEEVLGSLRAAQPRFFEYLQAMN